MVHESISEELLTAYALDELSTEEAATVERKIASDAEAQRTVAEIKRLGLTLRSSKAGKPLPPSPELLRAVEEHLKPRPMTPAATPMSFNNLAAVAVALLLIVGVGYLLVTSSGRDADRELAHGPTSVVMGKDADKNSPDSVKWDESISGRELVRGRLMPRVGTERMPNEELYSDAFGYDGDGDYYYKDGGGGFGSGGIGGEGRRPGGVFRDHLTDIHGSDDRIDMFTRNSLDQRYARFTPRLGDSQNGDGTTPRAIFSIENLAVDNSASAYGGGVALSLSDPDDSEARPLGGRRITGMTSGQVPPANPAPEPTAPQSPPTTNRPELVEVRELEEARKESEPQLSEGEIRQVAQHRWRSLNQLVGDATDGLSHLAGEQEGKSAERLLALQSEFNDTRKFLDRKKWNAELAGEEDLKLLEHANRELVESTRNVARIALNEKGEDRDEELNEATEQATKVLVDAREKLSKRPAVKDRPVESWRRSAVQANASRLMIGDREDLPLQGMQAMVQIDGDRARVLLDCYFENDREQQLEGNFQLRLPSEASLYYFAFGETKWETPEGSSEDVAAAKKSVREVFYEITGGDGAATDPKDILTQRQATWTEPKEARMVPREKAAFAYETIKRRRVDPALVEWAGAGIFSARVFPLAPGQVHRIVVGYDVPLERLGKELSYKLQIPEYVPDASVTINVAAAAGVTHQVTPKPDKSFEGVNRRFHQFKHPVAREFTVNLSGVENGVALVGEDPDKLGQFAAASFTPQLPADEPTSGAAEAVFLLDTSLSANPDQFNVWLKLLEATLENNRDTLQRFAVLTFNVETHWWQPKFVENTPENVAKLKEYCESLALEGATDLAAALTAASQPEWQDQTETPNRADYFLLSDAAATWGEQNAAMIGRLVEESGPVFCYRTGMTGTDTRMLNYLARESGGAVFSVVGEQQVEAASTAHRQRPWQILKTEWAGVDDLLLAGRPGTIFPGQQLKLVGRGTPEDAKPVVLTLRRGEETIQVETPMAVRVASDLAPRQYGQVAVEGLEELGTAAEAVAIPFARHFRITGSSCSLLMLESEEDYQQFDIKPENDPAVISKTMAGDYILQKLDEVAASLSDPKARFMEWVGRLPKVVPNGFKMDEKLVAALDKLPASAFEVPNSGLAVKDRSWESISEKLREPLATRQLDYLAIMAEAERRRAAHGPQDALKCASSLVELRPGDWVLARDVAFSAIDWGLHSHAYYLLRRVAEARPYEPQTYLAMADALQATGNNDLALLYYEVALSGEWDGRFGSFKQIAAVEYLRLLRSMERGDTKTELGEFVAQRLASIEERVQLATSDIVVIMMWNTNDTDVDMHIIEPNGEECYYGHQRTIQGGQLTEDVTQGYGPEMYTLPTAGQGTYQVKAHYFSSDTSRLSAQTRAIVKIYENWGTDQEKLLRNTFTLAGGGDVHAIHQIKRKQGPKTPKYVAPKEDEPAEEQPAAQVPPPVEGDS